MHGTLHQTLSAHGYTTLVVSLRDGVPSLALSAEFDDALSFSSYDRAKGEGFECFAPSPQGGPPRVTGHAASSLLGASGALLLRQFEQGGHQRLTLRVSRKRGLRVLCAVHSLSEGASGELNVRAAGGTRCLPARVPEREAVDQVLRLSRAMTFKSRWAQLPWGGTKLVVQGAQLTPDAPEGLGFLAACIDSEPILTGPDVGMSPAVIDAVRARYTPRIECGGKSSLGGTGDATACGVYVALETALRVSGAPPLGSLTVAVQGLGAVGYALARRLSAAGASLVVADTDPERVAQAVEQLGARAVAPEAIITAECDVLAPCAMGGVIHEGILGELRCRLICGGANNQLAVADEKQELELAAQLAKRRIVLLPDWTVTFGGIVQGYEVLSHGNGACARRLARQIEQIARSRAEALLRAAGGRGETPTAAALRMMNGS